MKQHKHNLVFLFLLTQLFFLLCVNIRAFNPDEIISEYDYDNGNNINFLIDRCCNDSPTNNTYTVAYGIQQLPSCSGRIPIDSCSIVHQASPALQHHFITAITASMYVATIHNHYVIVPGYQSPYNVHARINELSQFDSSDNASVNYLASRIKSYSERINNVLYNRLGQLPEKLTAKMRVALVHVYADFLKEFYCYQAPYLFYAQSQSSVLMQKIMPHIDWRGYDGVDYSNNQRTHEQRHAGALNGNLGSTYFLMQAGDYEKAYAIGSQYVKTKVCGRLWGEVEKLTSVFQQYPHLKEIY